MNENGKKQAIKAISLNTQTLVKRLSVATEGEIITYNELNGLIDMDVQEAGRGSLGSARRKVRTEHDIVFRTLQGIGIQRCNDDDKVEEIKKQRKRARNAAKEGKRIQEATEYEKLSDDKKREYNLDCSVIRAIDLFTKPQTQKKLQQSVLTNNTMIGVGDIAKLFNNA